MKYQVDQDKLARFLTTRPAMIKTITNLTEAFILKIFTRMGRDKHCAALYNALSLEFKTLAVTRAYIKGSSNWYFDYRLIPAAIRTQLTKEDRLSIIEQKVSVIEEMEDVTTAEWKAAIAKGYTEFENIPKEMWTKDMVLKVIGKTSYRRSYEFFKDIPGIWDEKFAEDVVEANPETLSIVPTHLISNAVLKLGANQTLDGIDIPTEAWDTVTATLALHEYTRNFKFIPKHLITRGMINHCADSGEWESLPHDYEAFVHYIASNPVSCYGEPEKSVLKWAKKVNPQKFILEVVALGCSIDTLTRHGFTITPELWLKILAIKPEYLGDVPKTEQMEEMVETFFSNANAELLDKMAEKINLGKIKAHHAPLMINCKSGLLIEIMNKFLKGDQKEEGANTIEVSISPAQFAKIRNALI